GVVHFGSALQRCVVGTQNALSPQSPHSDCSPHAFVIVPQCAPHTVAADARWICVTPSHGSSAPEPIWPHSLAPQQKSALAVNATMCWVPLATLRTAFETGEAGLVSAFVASAAALPVPPGI